MANHKDFTAYQMRASYLAKEGQFERAEEDYRKLTHLSRARVPSRAINC